MKTKSLVILALCSTTLLSAGPSNQSTYQYQQNQQDAHFKPTPRTIMDDEIAKNVHGILSGNWLSHGYPDVTFDVNNGTVNLRGVVDTRDEKNKVEQSVRKVEGVKNIRSDITVGLKPAQQPKHLAMNNSKNQSATLSKTATKDSAATDKDSLINSRIRERIVRWNPRGYETLVIATSNGAVTVTGVVDRVEDINKITNDAKNVDGVKSVTNQISIKRH